MGRKKKIKELPELIENEPIIVNCDVDIDDQVINLEKEPGRAYQQTDGEQKLIKCFMLFGKEFNIIDSLDKIGDYFSENNFVDGLTLNIKTIEVDERFLEQYKQEHGY